MKGNERMSFAGVVMYGVYSEFQSRAPALHPPPSQLTPNSTNTVL